MGLKIQAARLFAPLAVALLAFAAPASASTYDLTTDWSNTANPNGPFTYLAGTHVLPSTPNWSGFGPGFADSGTSGAGFAPSIFRFNGSGGVDISSPTGSILTHTQTVDANVGQGLFSIRFTSPETGLATISGSLWDAHISRDRDQAWSLRLNGNLLASGIVEGDGSNGYSAPDPIALAPFNISLGDLLVLQIIATSGGTETNGGEVGLDLNVAIAETSPVPLPAALPLLASALIGGAVIARRKKQKQKSEPLAA